jgi:C-terminal processing protease CtpA/Prc
MVRTLKSKSTKAMIIDMREYPYLLNIRCMRALIDEKVQNLTFLTPFIDYPGKVEEKFDTAFQYFKPIIKPVTNKVIVFLQSEICVSAMESVLWFAKTYKVGTLIGRHSVGTTGNINEAQLARYDGHYNYVTFTGMRTLTPDFTIFNGVAPDIEVPRTLDDLRNNRDEIMETAIKYIQGQLNKAKIQDR